MLLLFVGVRLLMHHIPLLLGIVIGVIRLVIVLLLVLVSLACLIIWAAVLVFRVRFVRAFLLF